MLTEGDVVGYLLERELIDSESIVEGDLLVIDASRRNHNFHVVSRRGPSYLVKQGTHSKGSMIGREAKIYQTLVAGGLGPEVSRYLPRYYAYDPEEDILILELLGDAEDARAYHLRTRRFSINLARAIGRSLGVLHRLPTEALPVADQEKLLALEPTAFYVDRPSTVLLHEFSQACIELVQQIQQSSEARQLLDDIRHDWRTDAFIHHDVRWDNILLAKRATASKKIELKLVDWESAGLGDPCWDVGSAFGDYLATWLGTVPVSVDAPSSRTPEELAQRPLETIQPALGALWQAYVREMGLDDTESGERLVRSTRYAGLKVIQSGFEQMQGAAQFTMTALWHLQTGVSMLQRPDEAAVMLQGKPVARKMVLR